MESIPKIHLSTEADQVLEEMVRLTNENFLSGRVKKTQLLSWIVLDFHKAQFQKRLEKIRADHFDKIAHLRSVIKNLEEAKRQGKEIRVESLLTPLKRQKSPMKQPEAKPGEK